VKFLDVIPYGVGMMQPWLSTGYKQKKKEVKYIPQRIQEFKGQIRDVKEGRKNMRYAN